MVSVIQILQVDSFQKRLRYVPFNFVIEILTIVAFADVKPTKAAKIHNIVG